MPCEPLVTIPWMPTTDIATQVTDTLRPGVYQSTHRQIPSKRITNQYWKRPDGLAINMSVSNPIESASEQAIGWPDRVEDPPAAASRLIFDMPTVGVAAAVFVGYGLATWFFRDLPLWIAGPLCAISLTWYGSLQHETIHNHPSSSRRFNSRLASLPLALWIPYRVYRVTHLQHHRHGGRPLTDVAKDPESFYLHAGTLAKRGPLRRGLYLANCTLAGRLFLGPAFSVYRFLGAEIRKIRAGDSARKAIWARHLVGVAMVLFWVTQICHIPLLIYVLCVIYPSISLTHLRSFAEHRADVESSKRTMAVEASLLWSLLFLNNNLHIAHHAYPKLPWYQLPATWRHLRGDALHRGLVLRGYLAVARAYLLRPVISPEHPGSGDDNAY
jgi:fatty acid desaturase